MKAGIYIRRIAASVFAAASLLAAGCAVSSSSSGGQTVTTAVLTKITITTQPTKTAYTVGDPFDPTGIVITAVYSNSTTKDVTSSSSVAYDGFDSSSAAASQTITVSYTESSVTKTATFTVSVSASGAATVTGIAASSTVTKYEIGTSFDSSAVTITLTYSDSTTASIVGSTSGVTYSGFDSSSAGTQTVTVSYAGQTASLSITVYKLDDIAYTKYATATTTALSSGQSGWGALNCHDPKLFQDTDGTYYVYSTDASIGNAHKTGLQVRSSSDLVNWTCSGTSAIQSYWDEDMLSALGQTSSTATTWAPTVIRQNSKYYMFHGIITDDLASANTTESGPTAWIGLAIADSASGPFKPAQEYDSSTYGTSTLVRYAWNAPTNGMSAYIGGEMTKMTVNSIKTTTSSGTTTDSTAKTLAATGSWYDVSTTAYSGVTGLTGDFTITYNITLNDVGDSNWQKWSFALIDNDTKAGWYLRADSWTNDFTSNSSVSTNMYGYGTDAALRASYTANYSWTDTDSNYFGTVFADGTTIIVTAAYTAATGTCVVTATSADGVTTYYTATGRGYSGDIRTSNNTASYNTTTKASAKAGWNNGFGAIDPEFVYDVADGSLKTFTVGSNTCYAMTFGSWKGGIALIYIDADTLKPVNASGNELDHPLDEETMSTVATKIAGGYGAAYEGAQLIYNSNTGYYYIFVSMGELNYEYRVGVGRCSTIDGTYVDAGGTSMNFASTTTSAKYHAVGSKIIGGAALDGEYSWRCPGGESILRTSDGKIMFACHSRTNFYAGYYFYLQLRQMFFTSDGWPVLNQNEYYDDYTGTDEKLAALTLSDIAGTYDTVLTVRGTGKSSFTPYGGTAGTYNTCDETPTASKTMVIASDGTISGDNYAGTLALASDGYTVTVTLTGSSGSSLGTFTGYVLKATDWARKGTVTRQTITFTTIDSTSGDTEAGEYFWGNKENY